MWRALQITCRIAWRIVEVAIVLHVLQAIHDPSASLIAGVLGLIYATIRSAFMGLGMGLVQLAWGIEQQMFQLKRVLGEQAEPPDDAFMKRFYVDFWIAGFFITVVYVICLLHVFTKL